MRELRAMRERDGDGVKRISMREVGRSVDGIDNPAIGRTLVETRGDAVFADNGVIGKGRGEGGDDRAPRFGIRRGNDRAVLS